MGGAVSAGLDNDDLVDNLLSGDYIRSPTVERVFRAVDRGDYFVPEAKGNAYKDVAWKHGHLHLSAPCIYSEVMEGLCLEPGLSFLNLGSGTGYMSTMAGLILGSNGVNHGIEYFSEVVDYANAKLEDFIRSSGAVDEFDFCEPKFVNGNCLCLKAGVRLYDRVYCGAACSEEHEMDLKNLLNIDGILVMPMNDQLLQITRKSEVDWAAKCLLPVSFATLIAPNSEQQQQDEITIADTTKTLQALCRVAIRRLIRQAIEQDFPELRTKARPTKPSMKRPPTLRRLVPLFDEAEHSSTSDEEGHRVPDGIPARRRGGARRDVARLCFVGSGPVAADAPPMGPDLLDLVLGFEHHMRAANSHHDDDDDDDDDDEPVEEEEEEEMAERETTSEDGAEPNDAHSNDNQTNHDAHLPDAEEDLETENAELEFLARGPFGAPLIAPIRTPDPPDSDPDVAERRAEFMRIVREMFEEKRKKFVLDQEQEQQQQPQPQPEPPEEDSQDPKCQCSTSQSRSSGAHHRKPLNRHPKLVAIADPDDLEHEGTVPPMPRPPVNTKREKFDSGLGDEVNEEDDTSSMSDVEPYDMNESSSVSPNSTTSTTSNGSGGGGGGSSAGGKKKRCLKDRTPRTEMRTGGKWRRVLTTSRGVATCDCDSGSDLDELREAAASAVAESCASDGAAAAADDDDTAEGDAQPSRRPLNPYTEQMRARIQRLPIPGILKDYLNFFRDF